MAVRRTRLDSSRKYRLRALFRFRPDGWGFLGLLGLLGMFFASWLVADNAIARRVLDKTGAVEIQHAPVKLQESKVDGIWYAYPLPTVTLTPNIPPPPPPEPPGGQVTHF